MQSFHINSFGADMIVATLLCGLFGAFVLIPVGCIQWLWNAWATLAFALPIINVWQAGLLYLAGICLLYLIGLLKIELKFEGLDDTSVLSSTEWRSYFKERIRTKHKSSIDLFVGDKDSTKKED